MLCWSARCWRRRRLGGLCPGWGTVGAQAQAPSPSFGAVSPSGPAFQKGLASPGSHTSPPARGWGPPGSRVWVTAGLQEEPGQRLRVVGPQGGPDSLPGALGVSRGWPCLTSLLCPGGWGGAVGKPSHSPPPPPALRLLMTAVPMPELGDPEPPACACWARSSRCDGSLSSRPPGSRPEGAPLLLGGLLYRRPGGSRRRSLVGPSAFKF